MGYIEMAENKLSHILKPMAPMGLTVSWRIERAPVRGYDLARSSWVVSMIRSENHEIIFLKLGQYLPDLLIEPFQRSGISGNVPSVTKSAVKF